MLMEGFEKKFSELETRIKRLEQAVERRDAMIMAHGLQLSMLCKDGVIWDRVKTDGNSE